MGRVRGSTEIDWGEINQSDFRLGGNTRTASGIIVNAKRLLRLRSGGVSLPHAQL